MAKLNDATVVSLDPLETDRLANGGHVVVEIDGELLVLDGQSMENTYTEEVPSFERSSDEIEEGDIVTERGSEERLKVVRVLDTSVDVYLVERGCNRRTLASEYPECHPSSDTALVRPEDDEGNPGRPVPVDALQLEERGG